MYFEEKSIMLQYFYMAGIKIMKGSGTAGINSLILNYCSLNGYYKIDNP